MKEVVDTGECTVAARPSQDARAVWASRSVVLLTSSLRGGGAERIIASLANYWSAAGARVTLVTLDKDTDGDFYSLDERVDRLHVWHDSGKTSVTRASAIFRRIAAIRGTVRKLDPDAVLSFLTNVNVLTIAACLGLKARVIVAERNHPQYAPVKQPYRLMRRMLYPLADAVVVQTSAIASWFTRHTKTRRITVIPNHVAAIVSASNPACKRVCFVGRLVEHKAVDDLLHAFANVAPEHPEWTLWVCGDGHMRTELEQTAKNLGIESKVAFLGQVEQPGHVLATASVFVLPSRYEGFPNALLEAMASGLVAIASDRAGSALICDGTNGLLYPCGCVSDLTRCLRLAMSDHGLRAQLAECARMTLDSHGLAQIACLWEEVLFPGGELSVQ